MGERSLDHLDLSERRVEGSDAFAMRVTGDEYAPRYQSGEFILFKPNHAISANDEVLVQLTDGSTLVRTFVSDSDGVASFLSVIGDQPQTIQRSKIERMYYISGLMTATPRGVQ